MPRQPKKTNVQYLKSSSKSEDHSNFVLIGKIVAAHGIKGAVKVVSYAQSDVFFDSHRNLWRMKPDGLFEPLEIKWCKPHKNVLRIGISNVINRSQAESMIGQQLFIDRAELPQLEEDTYYWVDLIGLEVKTTADQLIGHIDAIIPTVGDDVYVIKRSGGAAEKELLIPAVVKFIRRIDLDQGIMIVDLPEGL